MIWPSYMVPLAVFMLTTVVSLAMSPQPEIIRAGYRGAGKLEGKAAIVTGGDSGIGRSVAVHFAREGAEIAILYLDECPIVGNVGDLAEDAGMRRVAP